MINALSSNFISGEIEDYTVSPLARPSLQQCMRDATPSCSSITYDDGLVRVEYCLLEPQLGTLQLLSSLVKVFHLHVEVLSTDTHRPVTAA